MRYLLLLLGLISKAYGQFAPTSAKTAFKNGISIGTRDSTAYTANDSLVVVINRQGRMMYRSTDGYWKILSNASASDYVPYTGAVTNVNLGNFRLTASSLRTDSIYSNSSAGMYLLTNGGAAVAHWGGGGSVEVDFKGFAGYDANRSASYTTRSFTDKGYVDSADALRVKYTDTAAMLAGYKTYYPRTAISLTTTGSSGAATYNNATGVLNIPQYAPDLSGYVPYTGATANVNLGAFDLTADVITGATGSFSSSGSSNTLDITHSSGSGIALNITKSGNGEGLYINKTSGSGNAATIIGTLNATTLVKSGGTSSQFLKADGSVDGNTYALVSDLNGYVPTSRTLTINGTSFDLSANRSWSVGTVTAVTASAPLSSSGGTTPNITISQASGTTNGFLSSTDWTTFNNKANASLSNVNGVLSSTYGGAGSVSGILKANGSGVVSAAVAGTDYQTPITNPVTGTGTTNYLPKFTGSSAIGNSVMQEVSSNIGINITPTAQLTIKDELRVKTATTTGVGLSKDANGAYLYNIDNTFMAFGTNDIERLRISSTGNVGIGTSSPLTKLDIGGEGSPILRITSTSGPYSQIQSNTVGTLQFMADEGNTGASTSMRFRIDGGEVMRLDASGNLGLGVTPSAWAFFKAVQVNGGNSFVGYNNQAEIWNNSFYDGASKYYANGFATRYAAIDGRFEWYQAPSGTAGNAISFTQAMTLNASGRLLLNTTTDNGTDALQVNGSVRSSSSVTATDYRGSTASYSSAGTISANITTAFLTGNAYTINMPTATNGKVLIIIAETGLNTNGITLNGVNGGTYLLSCHHSLVLVGNGTTWKIASDYQNSAPCS